MASHRLQPPGTLRGDTPAFWGIQGAPRGAHPRARVPKAEAALPLLVLPMPKRRAWPWAGAAAGTHHSPSETPRGEQKLLVSGIFPQNMCYKSSVCYKSWGYYKFWGCCKSWGCYKHNTRGKAWREAEQQPGDTTLSAATSCLALWPPPPAGPFLRPETTILAARALLCRHQARPRRSQLPH